MLPLPYLDSRTLAGWLSACLAVGLIAGAAAFWSRSAAAAPVQDAQLRIADVRNVSSGPICAGSQASFDVDVANTGTAPATVALAMVGTNRNVLVRISGVFTVAPGATPALISCGCDSISTRCVEAARSWRPTTASSRSRLEHEPR
jgi:hypothetical protein